MSVRWERDTRRGFPQKLIDCLYPAARVSTRAIVLSNCLLGYTGGDPDDNAKRLSFHDIITFPEGRQVSPVSSLEDSAQVRRLRQAKYHGHFLGACSGAGKFLDLQFSLAVEPASRADVKPRPEQALQCPDAHVEIPGHGRRTI